MHTEDERSEIKAEIDVQTTHQQTVQHGVRMVCYFDVEAFSIISRTKDKMIHIMPCTQLTLHKCQSLLQLLTSVLVMTMQLPLDILNNARF